jgi:hypothetical protein
VRPWQPGKPPFKLIPSLFSLESLIQEITFYPNTVLELLAINFVDGDTIRVNVSKKAGWCLVNK